MMPILFVALHVFTLIRYLQCSRPLTRLCSLELTH
jgi:hypothetical protein